MSDEYMMNNGRKVESEHYVQALRGAWNVYGALVAEGLLPAYNLDGSEKVQLAKFLYITDAVDVIATAMMNYDTDAHYVNFAEWEKENKPTTYTYPRQNDKPRTVEDEDFPDPLPTDKDEPVSERELGRMEMAKFVNKALDALAEQGYYLTKDEPEAPAEKPDAKGYYHDMTPDRYDEVTPSTLLSWGFKIIPPEKPTKKGKSKGKKSKN